jgi:hypothetical protein
MLARNRDALWQFIVDCGEVLQHSVVQLAGQPTPLQVGCLRRVLAQPLLLALLTPAPSDQ